MEFHPRPWQKAKLPRVDPESRKTPRGTEPEVGWLSGAINAVSAGFSAVGFGEHALLLLTLPRENDAHLLPVVLSALSTGCGGRSLPDTPEVKVGRPTEHLKRTTTLSGDSPSPRLVTSPGAPVPARRGVVQSGDEEPPPQQWQFVHHNTESSIQAAREAERAREREFLQLVEEAVADDDVVRRRRRRWEQEAWGGSGSVTGSQR